MVAARLVLVKGTEDHPTESIILHNKDIVIGRGRDCDVKWDSLQISRRHAVLEYINEKWFIRDCSTNGLTVGSEELTKGIVRELKHRELIRFIPDGTLVYRFESSQPNPVTTRGETDYPILTVDENDDDDLSELQIVVDEDIDNANDSESLIVPHERLAQNFIDFDSSKRQQQKRGLSWKPQPIGKREISQSTDQDLHDRVYGKRLKESEDDQIWKSEDISNEEIEEKDTLEESQSLLASLAPKCDVSGQTNMERLQRKHCFLLKKFKLAEIENQSLKMEKTVEQEENRKKINDVLSRSEADREKQILDVLEQELSCCICNEIFIHPTVAECGHTFCEFCIREWTTNKPECPICRRIIHNPTKHIQMDNFLSKIQSLLPTEIRTERDQLISERMKPKEQVPIAAPLLVVEFTGGIMFRRYARLNMGRRIHPQVPRTVVARNNRNNISTRRSQRIQERSNIQAEP